jgi:hypothetical protein
LFIETGEPVLIVAPTEHVEYIMNVQADKTLMAINLTSTRYVGAIVSRLTTINATVTDLAYCLERGPRETSKGTVTVPTRENLR